MIDLPLPIEPYFVMACIAVTFLLIYRNAIQPLVGFMCLALLFVLTNIISTSQLVAGFANESILSIAMLLLITAGIRTNLSVEQYLDDIFSRVKSYKQFLFVMMTKVSLLSSFINNTPVVAIMTPYVFKWGKKNKISPSKLLIPLSFATICGGMITIIGTSTNLVLNGFLAENNLPGLNPFHLLFTGLLVTGGCILFIVIAGSRLLPNRNNLIQDFEQNKREYLVEKRLTSSSNLIGKTVYEAGLRNLKGVYLVEVVRGDQSITPVAPTEVLHADDTLIFAGETDNILEFTTNELGIELPSSTSKTSASENAGTVEVVISTNSSIVGRTVKESSFRNRYDAAVVAIHRNGERISGKIGDIKLLSGDVLLVYIGNDFFNKVELYKDVIVISTIDQPRAKSKTGTSVLAFVSLGAIALNISGITTLFISLLIITTYMFGTKFITVKTLKRELDLNMMLILVLSLTMGQAIIETNAGEIIASAILSISTPFGPVIVLLALTLITVLLTTFITNIGAVAIMFPIAMSISESMSLTASPFYLALAFGASAAFLSPIGYQTNLIIYGPGGYTFKDFIRIGLPVTAIYLLIAMVSICYLYSDSLF